MPITNPNHVRVPVKAGFQTHGNDGLPSMATVKLACGHEIRMRWNEFTSAGGVFAVLRCTACEDEIDDINYQS